MAKESAPKREEDYPRLIEFGFSLRQASLDSVHEKNIRDGHISTLHIWPARRPLAASRAVLISALLRDPQDPAMRKALLEKIGGKVVKKLKKGKKSNTNTGEKTEEETSGGVLHWGRETGSEFESLREMVRKDNDNAILKVLDPFAGGGAIPLEAMRLGCEAYAVDINPVAWFILRCTLEYPQKFAGKTFPLPKLNDLLGTSATPNVIDAKRKPSLSHNQSVLFPTAEADLSDHVQLWASWVLQKTKDDLNAYYPTFENKTTLAYIWARTVTCKNCGFSIPLLKTHWLCNKNSKKISLPWEVDVQWKKVTFLQPVDLTTEIEDSSQKGGLTQKIKKGTMSRSGARCPNCTNNPVTMRMEDIRFEGERNRIGFQMIAVVIQGENSKEYRMPKEEEIQLASDAANHVTDIFHDIPLGLPLESTPIGGGRRASRAFSIQPYGLKKWADLFLPRQLYAIGTFLKYIRNAREKMKENGYSQDWIEAIGAYLAAIFDRQVNQSNTLSRWNSGGEKIEGVFSRFALPMLWDFAEVNPLCDASGGFSGAIDWVTLVIKHLLKACQQSPPPHINLQSAIQPLPVDIDLIVTDPPYYDAIPYSDLMDFFYVWLKRTLNGLSTEYDKIFEIISTPKWDVQKNDGELIDDDARFDKDSDKSKMVYEDGMFRAFQSCYQILKNNGRLVIVFASKQPEAWETLVSAIIRAGFMVVSNWPIQTERGKRVRALSSAALSSSVWLVCRKRPEVSRPGWDSGVLEEMNKNIQARLREFWDAGIRGPDFVWAAIGPAMEVYSKYPVVKKANEAGKTLPVSEFLRAVRRIVVDFVVGRVLNKKEEAIMDRGLDDVTTYYLLHRHDFSMEEVPAGACILYAISCNLSDTALIDRFYILARAGKKNQSKIEEEVTADEEGEEEEGEKSGSSVKLLPWNKRIQPNIGYDIAGKPAPLIDQVHRIMFLWKQGDVNAVNEYIDSRGLWNNNLFLQIMQALVELAPQGDEERSTLESIINHLGAKIISTKRKDQDLFEMKFKSRMGDQKNE